MTSTVAPDWRKIISSSPHSYLSENQPSVKVESYASQPLLAPLMKSLEASDMSINYEEKSALFGEISKCQLQEVAKKLCSSVIPRSPQNGAEPA
jgi:hypothetical protein